ncbi:uncharacterized protein E0L32_011431 [Thyridium curvatum]|uniref:RanGTP-binding protein n=1 Tax=Thyridium curvatum TaxID=1093900 RepID=A0A507BMY7_9PEZI|nr:uncharacterized protein E0L32_011431 [Thyridium curvatum]TPX18879.1 hypothetical protein E0L32_011431 [Thyridium curvatum]
MDALLARLGSQALNMTFRCGIAFTSNFAFNQCSRLLRTVDDRGIRQELKDLQQSLNNKIKIISPAIDLIEFASGRGNVFMEGAVDVAKSVRRDILSLGKRLEAAAVAEECLGTASAQGCTTEAQLAELMLIVKDMRDLLRRIDQDIPALQLAISTSGVSLSASIPSGVSPSRLLQANTFLIFGDTQFASNPTRAVQVGPSFSLSLYMLFQAHGSVHQGPSNSVASSTTPSGTRLPEHDRAPVWQEVLHKARVRLCRTPLGWTFDREAGYVPPQDQHREAGLEPFPLAHRGVGNSDEFAYHLEIIEDLEDGRVHEDEGDFPAHFDDIRNAGIRESIPLHQISKIFYADTGRILNLSGDGGLESNPILLFKRDALAPTSTEMLKDLAENRQGCTADSIEQQDIDKQLADESGVFVDTEQQEPEKSSWKFPAHLDPEWLAFEVFEEDDDPSGDDDSDLEAGLLLEDNNDDEALKMPKTRSRPRSSVDSRLITQIRNVSLGSSAGKRPPKALHVEDGVVGGDSQEEEVVNHDSFISRSPFGAITTSLSLMEMLIRLASLQECQQASYLSLPDHIINFFLEETSTTGLRGEERWKVRNETKKKVGFDPFTDTPSK